MRASISSPARSIMRALMRASSFVVDLSWVSTSNPRQMHVRIFDVHVKNSDVHDRLIAKIRIA